MRDSVLSSTRQTLSRADGKLKVAQDSSFGTPYQARAVVADSRGEAFTAHDVAQLAEEVVECARLEAIEAAERVEEAAGYRIIISSHGSQDNTFPGTIFRGRISRQLGECKNERRATRL